MARRAVCPACGWERFVEKNDSLDMCGRCRALRLLLEPVGDWVRDGSCAQVDPDLWFPEHGTGVSTKFAVAICQACPVRAECLDYSIRAREEFGVWGGMTPRERKKVLKTMDQELVS